MSREVTTIQDVKRLAAEYGGAVTSYQPRPRQTCAAFTTDFLSRDAVDTLRSEYGAGVESLGLGMVVYFPWIAWKRTRNAQNHDTLRRDLIRLAYNNPETREAILPLLVEKKARLDEDDLPRRPRTPDESFFVDEIDGDWGVFGDPSGFCYATYSTESQAERKLKSMEEARRG